MIRFYLVGLLGMLLAVLSQTLLKISAKKT